MDRIKHIEKVFRLASPLSVVQRKNQKSRNAANLNPRQKHKKNQRKDRGRPEPLPQKIHHRNYCHAYGPVICPAQFCRRAQNRQRQHASPLLSGRSLKSLNHKQAGQQRKKYILGSPVKRLIMKRQIKRDLRNERKGSQSQQVFPGTARMHGSFYQEKAENRKRCPSDSAQNRIQAEPEIQIVNPARQR